MRSSHRRYRAQAQQLQASTGASPALEHAARGQSRAHLILSHHLLIAIVLGGVVPGRVRVLCWEEGEAHGNAARAFGCCTAWCCMAQLASTARLPSLLLSNLPADKTLLSHHATTAPQRCGPLHNSSSAKHAPAQVDRSAAGHGELAVVRKVLVQRHRVLAARAQRAQHRRLLVGVEPHQQRRAGALGDVVRQAGLGEVQHVLLRRRHENGGALGAGPHNCAVEHGS